MSDKLFILGSGGHGHVVADAAIKTGLWDSCVFYDDNPQIDNGNSWPIAGNISAFMEGGFHKGYSCFVGIGENSSRIKIVRQIEEKGWPIATIIHPFSSMGSNVSVGVGSVVCAGSVIGVRVTIGESSIINTSCSIDHDCIIGENVHISPGVRLAGGVCIGSNSWVGIGTNVRENIKIGPDTVIGAGSLVIDDIPGGVLAMGSPARVVKSRNLS